MYETVLVGIDDSESAQKALEHAVELAQAVGATLHVVTVVDSQANPMKFGITEVAELHRAKTTLVDRIANAIDDGDLTAEIRRGDPPDALLEYASEIDADLLVVGESEAGRLESAIFDGTTEQLAKRTQIPLTIVPLQNED